MARVQMVVRMASQRRMPTLVDARTTSSNGMSILNRMLKGAEDKMGVRRRFALEKR